MAMRGLAAALLCLIAGCSSTKPRPLALTQVEKTVPQSGFLLVSARLHDGVRAQGRMVAGYFDLARWRPEVVLNPDKDPVKHFAGKAALTVNGGYFTEAYKPTGLLLNQSETLYPLIRRGGDAGSGVLIIRGSNSTWRPILRPRADLEPSELKGAEFAIQAGPRVLEADGSWGIRKSDGKVANRTFIGYDRSNRLVLGAVFADEVGFGPPGLTLFELQRILSSLTSIDETLSLKALLNLDGGPSTALYTRGVDHAEGSPVASVIRVVAR